MKKEASSSSHWLLDQTKLGRRGVIGASLLLALVAIATYLPATSLEWIWDDDQYIYSNPYLRSLSGLHSIWFDPTATPQYYPVVFSVLWFCYQAVGDTPSVFHGLNVTLHACNAVLCFLILRSLDLRSSLWVALAFALHPIQVETVAWATELKNVLSAFFYACSWLTLWQVVDVAPSTSVSRAQTRDPDVTAPSRKRTDSEGSAPSGRMAVFCVALGLLCFAFALLSKSVTASLPAAMLVALWYRHGRIQLRQLALLLPMLVVGALAGWNTARLERLHVGAAGADWNYGLVERCGIAARSIMHYAQQAIVPLEQVFFYPRFAPELDYAAGIAILGCVTTLAFACFYAFARSRRGPLAALLFFAGSAFPALGFLNVYPHRFSFVADHFVYVPIVGLLAIIWSILLTSARMIQAKFGHFMATAPLILLLAFYVLQTRTHIPTFQNSVSLWQDTLKKNPACPAAMQNLALKLFQQGESQEALAWLDKAIAFDFDRFQTLNSKGMVLGSLGRVDEAIQAFQDSIELNPSNPTAWVNLGNIQRQMRSPSQTYPTEYSPKECYLKSWEAKPNYLAAFALGTLSYEGGDKQSAVDWFRKAAEVRPWDIDANYNLAQCLFEIGKFTNATSAAESILRFHPDDRPTRSLLRKIRNRQ